MPQAGRYVKYIIADGTAGIEFVNFHVVADLNVPAETLFENAVTKPMHFGDVTKERDDQQ